ncbi:MAG: hypothetical protein IKB32_03985 [Clostridia bacterium]|nr:hypothetical protein [Clostridia bacterium]
MKKFYESPIVELTVFDVEDVITASGIVNTITDGEDVEALIQAINNNTYTGTVDAAEKYVAGSYNW